MSRIHLYKTYHTLHKQVLKQHVLPLIASILRASAKTPSTTTSGSLAAKGSLHSLIRRSAVQVPTSPQPRHHATPQSSEKQTPACCLSQTLEQIFPISPTCYCKSYLDRVSSSATFLSCAKDSPWRINRSTSSPVSCCGPVSSRYPTRRQAEYRVFRIA